MPSLFDQAGNHWQIHGASVAALNHRGVAAGAIAAVHSQFDTRRHGRPLVLVEAQDSASTVHLRLMPADARSLAQALLQAADTADKVQALRGGRQR